MTINKCIKILNHKGEWVATRDSFQKFSWLFPIYECYLSLSTPNFTVTLQTSGSTGNPKAISVSNDAFFESAFATKAFFNISPACNLLLALPINFIAGKMMLFRALAWGCNLWATSPNDIDIPNELDIELVALLPVQLQHLINAEVDLKNIKTILLGGTAINKHQLNQFTVKHANIYQSFGMTETVSHIALRKLEHNNTPYTVLPGIEISANEQGNLVIYKAPNVKEPLTTTDLIQMVGLRSFFWLGRADWVINSGGVKIHAAYLETLIDNLEIPPHLDFKSFTYFVGRTLNPTFGQSPILIIQAEEPPILQQNELLAYLKQHLPKYHAPISIVWQPKLELTATGKPNKRAYWQ